MKKFSLFLLSLLVVFTLSCNKDENSDAPSASNSFLITLVGQINDENGQGVPNVIVQVGNKIGQSDANGIYFIEKATVNKSRAVVKASKNGYWNRSIGFIPSNATVQYCNFVISQKTAATSIQSSAGGTVTNGGATVVFPANAFVNAAGTTYNGNVNVSTKHLSTTDPNFGALIPGGDLMAEDITGTSVKLISFGMMGVELTDNNGNALELAPGMTSTIQLPIASAQLATAPATIPLWYFDETKSLWVEEGSATKVGNNYIGQVEHFSWWNCDMSIPSATIEGYVIDCDGNPVQNAKIYIDNIGLISTNQNGFYSGLITSGSSSTIKALFAGIFTNMLILPALTAGQVYTVPNLVFNCSGLGIVKANFVDCNNLIINPYVSIATSGGNILIVPQNGAIRAYVPCGSNILAVNLFGSPYVNTYTQLCYPDSSDLGTIVICDTSTTTQGLLFSMNLTSPSNNLNYTNPMYISGSYNVNDSAFNITAGSPSPPQSLECYLFNFPIYTPGTYTLQNFPNGALDIEYYNGSKNFIIWTDSTTQNFTVSIIKNGAVGDTMELMLSGNVKIEDMINSTVEYGSLNSLHVKCIRNQ